MGMRMITKNVFFRFVIVAQGISIIFVIVLLKVPKELFLVTE